MRNRFQNKGGGACGRKLGCSASFFSFFVGSNVFRCEAGWRMASFSAMLVICDVGQGWGGIGFAICLTEYHTPPLLFICK